MCKASVEARVGQMWRGGERGGNSDRRLDMAAQLAQETHRGVRDVAVGTKGGGGWMSTYVADGCTCERRGSKNRGARGPLEDRRRHVTCDMHHVPLGPGAAELAAATTAPAPVEEEIVDGRHSMVGGRVLSVECWVLDVRFLCGVWWSVDQSPVVDAAKTDVCALRIAHPAALDDRAEWIGRIHSTHSRRPICLPIASHSTNQVTTDTD